MATTLENMQIEKIRPHQENIRLKMDDLKELVASVKSQGVLQPLTVAPHLKVQGDFVVIAGHRRLAAAKRAGLSYLPVVINPDLNTKAKQITAMLVENTQRKDITPVEEAKAYEQLQIEGLSVAQMSKGTGRSKTTIQDRLKITKLSVEVQEKIEDHTVTIERAMDIARFEKHPELAKSLEVSVTDSSHNWAYITKRATEKMERLDVLMPRLQEVIKAGLIKAVDRPEGPSWNWREKGVRNDTTPFMLEYLTDEKVKGYAADGWDVVLDEKTADGGHLDLIQKLKDPKPVELTPEQIEAQKRNAERARIDADLVTTAKVEQDWLAELVANPPRAGGAREALLKFVRDVVRDDIILSLTGMEAEGPALEKLSIEGLAVIVAASHYQPGNRGAVLYATEGYWADQRIEWDAVRVGMFGYKYSKPELEALEYWAPKPVPEAVEDVTEACRDCKQSVVGGEGWDGHCGDCADRVQAAVDATWEES